MKKITPSKTFNGALRALDNGGRFYNIFTDAEDEPPRTVIATSRGRIKIETSETRFGGFLKKLTFNDPTPKKHGLFLETIYYTPLEDSLLRVRDD